MKSYTYTSKSLGLGFKKFTYEITNAKEDLKILVISDIHYYQAKDNQKLENLLMLLKSEKYDAILLAGDLIDALNIIEEHPLTFASFLAFLADLSNIAPLYLTFGQHDYSYYIKNSDSSNLSLIRNQEILKEAILTSLAHFPNIHIIENSTVKLKSHHTLSIFNPSVRYTFLEEDSVEYLSSCFNHYQFLKELNSADNNILLCSYPNLVRALYALKHLHKINLAICAQTHNGLTQSRFLPLERMLAAFNQPNLGLQSPKLSSEPASNHFSRGVIELSRKTNMLINPAITSLPYTTGFAHYFDPLFYKGFSEIHYISSPSLKFEKRSL